MQNARYSAIKRRHATLAIFATALMTAGALMVSPAHAQPCGGSAIVDSDLASNFRSGVMATKSQCTAGSPVGAATNCFRTLSASVQHFVAYWPSSAARAGDATGGCVFMCLTGGNCRVGNDGLPVELLQFGVE